MFFSKFSDEHPIPFTYFILFNAWCILPCLNKDDDDDDDDGDDIEIAPPEQSLPSSGDPLKVATTIASLHYLLWEMMKTTHTTWAVTAEDNVLFFFLILFWCTGNINSFHKIFVKFYSRTSHKWAPKMSCLCGRLWEVVVYKNWDYMYTGSKFGLISIW